MLALALVSVSLLPACATKGFVRRQVDEQRQALAAERQERVAADDAMRSEFSAQITALRGELQTMRTEFSAQISALEGGLQFAFPVNFAFDDSNVRQQDMAALDRFVQVAQKYYPNSAITIEGFADPAGSAAYNRQLSESRAENVKAYLVSKGMSAELVKSVGYGENRLVSPGASGDQPGAEFNRRVVFVIETKGSPMSAVAVVPSGN
jgi:peptidoglycan-associated lipoprotein